MKFFLNRQQVTKCIVFAHRCAENQQYIEFGQHDTCARSLQEIARDNLIGKLAEVAFAEMLKRDFKLDVPLDFNYYPRGKWDEADVIINGWRIAEAKKTHVFVMAVIGWNRNSDLPTGIVDLIGYTSRSRLREGIPKTYVIRKGDLLPGKRIRMQADNFGIKFSDLDTNWNFMISKLLEQSPKSQSKRPLQNSLHNWILKIMNYIKRLTGGFAR